MVDFATRVAKSFKDKVSGIDNKKGTDIQGVLGLDSTPNVLFASVFAAGGGSYDNFFYKVENGRADFRNFANKGTSYKNLEKVYNDYKNLIGSNGLFASKDGSYSSNFEKFHQLAFYVGSSSGYNYAFADETAKRLKFGDSAIEYPNDTLEIKAPTNNSQSGDGNGGTNNDNLLGTFDIREKSNGKKGESNGKQGNGQDKKTISLYKDSIPKEKTEGTDAILISDNQLINQLQTAAKTSSSQNKANTAAITFKQSNKSETDQSTTSQFIGYTTTASLKADKKNIFDVKKLNNEKSERKIIVGATVETLNQANTLQANEAIIKPAPGKYQSTDSHKVMITQGPNIVGIHANEKEDKETQKFINWYLNKEESWSVQNSGSTTTKKQTAAQYFAEQSSYITPLKNNFKADQSATKDSTVNNNYFTKQTFDLFKEVNDGKVLGFNDPSDFRSGKFRNTIGSTFNATISSKVDFNKFFENFKASLGSGFER